MKKPPFIKLYIKDLAFDIRGMTKSQIGDMVLSLIESYKSGEIPENFSEFSPFISLKNSIFSYDAVCERNRENRLKTKSYNNESSTTGQRLVNDSLNQNQNQNQNIILYEEKKDDKKTKSTTLENYIKHNFPDEQLLKEWGIEAAKITNWEDDMIDREWDKFKDYWKAANNNTKKDWRATWRNWLRNSLERGYKKL